MREGFLARPIPMEWEAYRRAIMPEFFSPFGAADYWTAAYLPVNSAIQALFWQAGDPNLAGPALLMAGLFALWRVGLHLFPERPDGGGSEQATCDHQSLMRQSYVVFCWQKKQ